MLTIDAVNAVAGYEPVANRDEVALLVLILDGKELVHAGLQALDDPLRLLRHAQERDLVEIRHRVPVRIAPSHPLRKIGSVDRQAGMVIVAGYTAVIGRIECG